MSERKGSENALIEDYGAALSHHLPAYLRDMLEHQSENIGPARTHLNQLNREAFHHRLPDTRR